MPQGRCDPYWTALRAYENNFSRGRFSDIYEKSCSNFTENKSQLSRVNRVMLSVTTTVL